MRVTDHFALVLSEAMMTGQLHLAILYDSGPIKGVLFERLITEELLLVCAPGVGPSSDEVTLEALADVPLLLPRPVHTIHATVNRSLEAVGAHATVVAELESVGLMAEAVAAGLGATMLPRSVAERLAADSGLRLVRVSTPIEVHLSLGTPSSLPLSRAAECVRDLLRRVVARTLVDPAAGVQ